MTEIRMPATIVADAFGSYWHLAKELGKTHSTCQRWVESGLIPAKYQRDIVDAARRLRIKLPRDVFIPTDDALAKFDEDEGEKKRAKEAEAKAA